MSREKGGSLSSSFSLKGPETEVQQKEVQDVEGPTKCVVSLPHPYVLSRGLESPTVFHRAHSWLEDKLKLEVKSPALYTVIFLLITFLKMFTL